MVKQDIVELDISGLNNQGEGVGRWQGMAVFVPHTAPGDRARVVIAEEKRNYARAKLIEVISPARIRRDPDCSHASGCGGCRLQHIDYQAQLKLKAEQVEESLRRIGKLTGVKVLPVLGMADPWHYRNKVVFQVAGQAGQAVLGLYGAGSNVLGATPFGPGGVKLPEPAAGCKLVHRDLNLVAATVQELLARYRVTAWDKGSGRGLLRQLLLRRAPGTDQIMVALLTGPGTWTKEQEFAEDLKSKFKNIASVVRVTSTGGKGRSAKEVIVVLAGGPQITDRLDGLSFQISPGSFYQVNSAQTSVLYRQVLDYIALSGGEQVLDAYCGVGTIALFLARRAGRVLALEEVPEAVRDAEVNARLNGITNAEFIRGDAAVVMTSLAREGFKPHGLVLDPPRRGCAPGVLQAVADMQPQRVVYVSCDPSTLSRDLGRLEHLGYHTLEVQPVDMFPHTAHIECVVRIDQTRGQGDRDLSC